MDFDHDDVRLAVNEDRLSSLPDELIHRILSCIEDTKFVVQTCLLLSPRWKHTWKSMPCLSFNCRNFKSLPKFSKFVTNTLSRRNRQTEVSLVKLYFCGAASQAFVKKIANYAFSHNVQQLTVNNSWPKNHHDFPPCLFSSPSLKHFTFSSCLYAPCLTPKTPWNFPALTSLHISDITLCDGNVGERFDIFSKCVNLKSLTLKRFVIKDAVFDIIAPQLSNLMLIDDCYCAMVINVIAPQLENLTIVHCSIKLLNPLPGLSSLCYKGFPPKCFKDSFHSLNKATVSLSLFDLKMPYREVDARETIDMLQEIHGVRFLTLNLDIVECLSSFPGLVSSHPSPFSNLVRLTIDSSTRKDTYKVKLSTEARNFLLENSPSATFIMDLPEDPPTKATKAKEDREKKRAKLIADIESCMKELQALLEQENTVLVERKKAEEKTRVAFENIVAELKVWAKKKMMRSEPEQPKEYAESQEVVVGLMTQFRARVTEMQDLGKQNFDVSLDFRSKKEWVILLFKNLLKRKRAEMEKRYARQLEEAESLSVRLHSTYKDAYNYLNEMIDGVAEYLSDCNSTCQDVSSSKLPLASQPSSSSSAIIPAPSTSSINPLP